MEVLFDLMYYTQAVVLLLMLIVAIGWSIRFARATQRRINLNKRMRVERWKKDHPIITTRQMIAPDSLDAKSHR